MDGQARSVEIKSGIIGDSSAQGSGGGWKSKRQQIDVKELTRLFEELPPHAIEAEMSLLGSMLLDPRVIGDTVMVLKGGEDFFKPANGAIYDAMVKLYDRHAAVDIVQLNQALLDGGVLETVGGAEYLVQLAEAVPSSANAVHYARLVREKSVVRQLINAAGEILYSAFNRADESQSVL
ncbi:MAG TPA: DnaB-like helicase N-terminal domain-containing protein, partial [Phycisphaerales bacterium]|nr:DnaB-like helicase N-terminal domain-containing protein [Phycisphaerales bacterium]